MWMGHVLRMDFLLSWRQSLFLCTVLGAAELLRRISQHLAHGSDPRLPKKPGAKYYKTAFFFPSLYTMNFGSATLYFNGVGNIVILWQTSIFTHFKTFLDSLQMDVTLFCRIHYFIRHHQSGDPESQRKIKDTSKYWSWALNFAWFFSLQIRRQPRSNLLAQGFYSWLENALIGELDIIWLPIRIYT